MHHSSARRNRTYRPPSCQGASNMPLAFRAATNASPPSPPLPSGLPCDLAFSSEGARLSKPTRHLPEQTFDED